MKGVLPRMPTATIGVEFGTRIIELKEGGKVKMQIWDTAGQERYRATTSAYYRKAVGALLVYDLTRRTTFQNCEKWLAELRAGAGSDIVVMLVGNKVDLPDMSADSRQVESETAEQFAQQNDLLFLETSAVMASNCSAIFEHLLQEIYNRSPKRELGKEERQHGERLYLGSDVLGARVAGC